MYVCIYIYIYNTVPRPADSRLSRSGPPVSPSNNTNTYTNSYDNSNSNNNSNN